VSHTIALRRIPAFPAQCVDAPATVHINYRAPQDGSGQSKAVLPEPAQVPDFDWPEQCNHYFFAISTIWTFPNRYGFPFWIPVFLARKILKLGRAEDMRCAETPAGLYLFGINYYELAIERASVVGRERLCFPPFEENSSNPNGEFPGWKQYSTRH